MTPIFQMVFETQSDSSIGLVFSEEADGFNQPVFVLPLRSQNINWSDEDFYLPGEIEGQYKEFRLSYEKGFLLIKDEKLKNTIRFGIGLDDMYLRKNFVDRYLFYRNLPFKYIGKNQSLVYPFEEFIPLLPLDLLIMDNEFRQQKACFVGLTPLFGKRYDR